ncbi:MAG: AbrB family transcriptional regulator [Loktanella sp.]|jgi:membrane AbrB-like protein|nr:AbrB family transcriptional regulator [Loktanella sp.]MDO7608386.1 AbrB family transcriptional regulator [Loktanella sp.]MDO7622025.1 AbrB family transcriptional regulator [Loktanella sp.]MDO7625317.1 AbrB family transcriptional regulator [Loktanella sp.]MDO7664269.1 AbrB family transcriptional regulator [Loktanella sp.]
MKYLALTYVIAGIGVGIFIWLQLPLPWLLGPIFACLIAALAGVPMKGNKLINDAMRSILGVAVGATFTTTLLISMAAMWPTLLMIPVMVACIAVIGVPYFQRVWGFDFATSYYSAMPGGLQDMLAFGEEAGGDVRALSLIHATRVMVVVVALPFILQGYWGADLTNPPGAAASTIDPSQMLLMVFCGIAGWQGAKALGMFGASILGPLILAAIMALLGVLQHRPPAEAIWMAQFFIGMTVGTKYAGVTGAEVRKDVAAALGFCLILIALTFVFAEAVHLFHLAPPMETLLAFAPGGQAEMTVLALIVGADMAFVIAHHVLRIFVVILGAPIAARLWKAK